MTDDTLLVHGSGNIFEDLGLPGAQARQTKALLAAEIVKVLDADGLTTREAQARTGVAHSEFSRIRNARLARFTIDRLLAILGRLGREVEMNVSVRQAGRGARVAGLHP